MPGGGPTVVGSDNPMDNVTSLKGMPDNPGRDPKAKDKSGRGTIGDNALMDGIVIVVLAWVILVFLVMSLRHHNV